MSKKAVNWLYLAFLLTEFGMITLIAFSGIELGVIWGLILNQLIFFVPMLVFLAATRTRPGEVFVCKKLNPATPVLCVVFTGLCMPLIMVANMVSMLFVDNEANRLGAELFGTPAWLMVLVIGLLGPANEEFLFRGVFYQSYRKLRGVLPAMFLSAFLFALMHLNFNQMSYAFVVGILGVLLVEATGNTICTIIFHVCINTGNVIAMIMQQDQLAAVGGSSQALVNESLGQLGLSYRQFMTIAIVMYGMIALVTTTLAVLLLYAMSCIEKRNIEFIGIWKNRHRYPKGEKKVSLWSIPLIIAVALSFIYMIIMTGLS